MRVACIQSCYIPWRGYFDFIDSVDLFVIFDDVQYPTGRSWRNRNRLKTAQGVRWLTVPVRAHSSSLPIDQVRIGQSPKPWRAEHRRLLTTALEPAPYFHDAMRLWTEGVKNQDQYLSVLNRRLIDAICEYLGIRTKIVDSRPYGASGRKTDRLIDIMKRVGGEIYVSGPTAKGYLEEDSFRRNGIGLEYKTYDYPPYPQLWGSFEGAVTVLDLIANCGPKAKLFIKSLTPNEVAVWR